MPFDDDAEADNPGFCPPPHPDDRLWRHPSEMSAHPIVPIGASTPRLVDTPASPARRRPWGAYAVAGALGAVIAGGGVMMLGVGERVVERPVTERVALNPTLTGLEGADSLEGLRQRVAPAVVGIDVAGADGGTARAGSGVVVRDDGIVVTSAALAAAGTSPTVRLPDGRTASAQVLGADQATGLAVLDLAGDGYTPSVLAGAGHMATGEQTVVLSAGDAADAAPGTGSVASTERYLGPSGTALDGVEITGAADDGALGGPVVDDQGVVVGIVTTVAAGEAWYAAPVEVAHKVADDVLAGGTVDHSWLGIEGTDVADVPADESTGTAGALGTTVPPAGGGTQVVSVVPESPAARGGLAPGDVIVALDGEPVTRMPDLLVRLRSRSPGDRVDVTVTRSDGSQVTLVLTLTAPPLP